MPTHQRIQNTQIPLGYEYLGADPPTLKYVTETFRQDLRDGDGGHYGYPDFPYDRNVGGTFDLWSNHTWYVPSPSFYCWRGGALNQHYIGKFTASINGFTFPGTVRDGSAWGPELYSKMKPTKPLFQGLNSIYELKDVPGMLRQRFHFNGLKDLGDFHLALQFGWLQLLRDARNLVHTQRIAQKRLAWLLAHNGKPIRRKVTLFETMSDPVTTTGQLFTSLQPGLVTQYYQQQPKWQQVDFTRDTVWGSARFRYWLPDGPRDVNWTRRMLFRIFGIQFPTPSMIYNAIPWTWLVDWFSNAGDCLENLDAGVADRCAADYFYVMRTFFAHREFHAAGRFFNRDGSSFPVEATSYSENSQRSRLKGDPFGFSTNSNLLSGMQLSILGALGLSRLR